MKRVILHIGTHKTGTTSIQEWLAATMSEPRDGVVYLPSHRFQEAHHAFAWSILPRFRASPIARPHIVEPEKLTRAIEKAPGDTVIVSTENLCFALADNIARLAEVLKPFDTRVVAFLRRQDRYIESEYVQRVKQLVFPEFRSFQDFLIWAGHALPQLNYHALVHRWHKHFPDIVAVNFDHATRNGGVLKAFTKASDLTVLNEVVPETERHDNIALDFRHVAIMRLVNGLPLEEEQHKKLRSRMAAHVSAMPEPGGRLTFYKAGQAYSVYQGYYNSNERMREMMDTVNGGAHPFEPFGMPEGVSIHVDTESSALMDGFLHYLARN